MKSQNKINCMALTSSTPVISVSFWMSSKLSGHKEPNWHLKKWKVTQIAAAAIIEGEFKFEKRKSKQNQFKIIKTAIVSRFFYRWGVLNYSSRTCSNFCTMEKSNVAIFVLSIIYKLTYCYNILLTLF